jgi:hypothetical protein
MMILTDAQHESTKKTLRDLEWLLHDLRKEYEGRGYTRETIQALTDPYQCQILEMGEEITQYNGLKAGVIPPIDRDQFPMAVVWCRIASGMTQEEFAKKRNVSPEQLQRDERNGYHGISVTDAHRLMALTGFQLQPVSMYELVVKKS